MPTVPIKDPNLRNIVYGPWSPQSRRLGQDLAGYPEEPSTAALPAPILMGAPPMPESRADVSSGEPVITTPAPAEASSPGFFGRLFQGLQKPEAQAFLLNMGANLLRPRQFGESEAQQIGQSLVQGYGGLTALEARRRAEVEAARKADLEQRKVVVSEKQQKALADWQQQQVQEQAATRKQTGELKQKELDLDWNKLQNERDKTQLNQQNADAEWVRQTRQLTLEEGKLAAYEKALALREKAGVVDTATKNMQASAAQAAVSVAKIRAQTDLLKLIRSGTITDVDRAKMALGAMNSNYYRIMGDPLLRNKPEVMTGLENQLKQTYDALGKLPSSQPTTAMPGGTEADWMKQAQDLLTKHGR